MHSNKNRSPLVFYIKSTHFTVHTMNFIVHCYCTRQPTMKLQFTCIFTTRMVLQSSLHQICLYRTKEQFFGCMHMQILHSFSRQVEQAIMGDSLNSSALYMADEDLGNDFHNLTKRLPPFCHRPGPLPSWQVDVIFWIEGIALCIVGSFGIVGNILTCAVLRR